MKYFSNFYQSNKKILTVVIFPCVLFFYPFLTVNQGVDVSDSLYSLTNFRFFPEMEGMWIVSTYVSNVIGYLLTKLPFGTTVLGMKWYTGIFVSLTSVTAYSFFRKWMPAWICFLGQLIAVSYCWIPTGILYNYLTYFFFTIGLLFLYKGLVEEKNSCLLAAGFFLGVNLFVRIPNLTQISLIAGAWYYLWIKKTKLRKIFGKTAYCISGYLLGMIIPLMGILMQYGISGLAEMITGLGGVGEQDGSYTLFGMILSTFQAYARTSKWVMLMVLGIFMGTAMFLCCKGRWEVLKKASYLLGILVLLRFLWGRGMFTFRYYEDYTSMYEWGMIALYLAWIGAGYLLISSKSSQEEKLWAVFSAIVLAITPLGSNNYTYQNLNNMFFIAPVTVYTYVKLLRRREKRRLADRVSFPWKAMVTVLGLMILIQGIGFHQNFVFRDGMDGQKREYRFQQPAVLAGMKTTVENGEELSGLLKHLDKSSDGNRLLLLGDCPGLSFLTGMAPAIHTAWPDLESESYGKIEKQLQEMEEYPVVIIREKEYITEQGKKKKQLVEEYVSSNHYRLTYESGRYFVFEKKE
ncbi:MAG: hypothetical protein IKW28_11270 [Lachnospiraceae bacterium]|nr:hypothetical protein [Lachnospiraceae bacterium]